jgi:hypothetical protein
MGQTIGEAIWEEGRLKGLSEGKLEGKHEGELKALRQSLRRLLVDRFGKVSDAMLHRIENSADTDRLLAAIVQVLHIDSPEKLEL